MTINEQNEVIIQIEKLNQIDVEQNISEAYPNQENLDAVTINKLTVIEFASLLKKIVRQIGVEIQGENRAILPYIFSSLEFGQGNLLQHLSNLNTQIINKHLVQAERSLMWLAQYCLVNGFHDKSKYKLHSKHDFDFEKQKTNLDIISSNYEQLVKKYNILLDNLEKEKIKIDTLYKTKQSELQQIATNLNNSNNNTSQIQALLNASTQSNTKVNSLTEQSEKDYEKIEYVKRDIEKTYNVFKDNYNELINRIQISEVNFEHAYKDFENKLNFIESKTEYFRERNNYLDDLIGREVGVSLFETFKQRKGELKAPLKWWKITVIAISVLTFCAIWAIFTNFFGILGDVSEALRWQNIVANTFKSTPIFFLLYFSITQYNKERNYQEEYAFKSATALTIKAYADILKDDVKKDELVLRAVLSVYTSPIYNKTKSNKDINSTLDMLSEIVGKGVEKGVEVLTKK